MGGLHFIGKTGFTVSRVLPFLEAWKLSSLGTYCISYTRVVRGRMCLSLLMRYTAYLKASSALLSLWSSVNIAPENSRKRVLLAHSRWIVFIAGLRTIDIKQYKNIILTTTKHGMICVTDNLAMACRLCITTDFHTTTAAIVCCHN
jgi:hypothetical protein